MSHTVVIGDHEFEPLSDIHGRLNDHRVQKFVHESDLAYHSRITTNRLALQTMRMLGAIVRATLAGTAAALAVPAIIFSIALFKSFSEPETIRSVLAIGLFVLAVMLILIGSSVVLLDITISILLRRTGRESRGAYALFGALSGFAVTFIWWLIGSRPNAHDISVDLALIAIMGAFGAGSGALTGVVFGRSLGS